MRKTGKTMATKTASIVTVQAVRSANGKMISASRGNIAPPAAPSTRVASQLKDVSTAGHWAMQQSKK